MRKTECFALVMMIVPGVTLAQGSASTSCTNGDMVRRVVIASEPGVSVPCEVHYYKDTEAPGEHQVLWSASQQVGYCEEKSAELVAKLEGWGWDCGGTPAAPSEPAEPAEPADAAESAADADMTEDLLPPPDDKT